MDPYKNPFAPHAGTPPPELAGREAPLMEAELAIGRALAGHAPKGVLITGLRGVGKTVLLNRFTEIAEQRRIEAIMLEAPESGDFLATLARDLRRTVLRLERGGLVSETMRRALGVFKSFSVTFATDGTLSLGIKVEPEQGYADSGDPELDLRDLFVALGEAARERDTALMLAIDELQYLPPEQFTAIIRAVHRTAQLKLPVIVCGAGLPNLPALAGEAKTYAERLFTFRTIGSLTPNDVRTAINQPAKELGASFSDAAVDEIIEVTKGYPYFVQEWAHDSWNVAKGPVIDLADVQRATPDVHARLDEGFFRVRFDRLTDKEQQYLRGMAEIGEGPHGSGEIADKIEVSVTSIAPIRDALIRKGMIYSPSHGEAAFSVPLFDRFMKRAMPELPKGRVTARSRASRRSR
jgi:GTPase SAR1 family protein